MHKYSSLRFAGKKVQPWDRDPVPLLVHYLLGEEHGHVGKGYVQHILWIDEGQNNNLFSGILLFVGTNDADGHHYPIEVYTK